MVKMTFPEVDIGIVCSDFKESMRFYHEQLGFEIALDLQIPKDLAVEAGLAPDGFHHIRLKAGNILIKLMEIQSPPPKRSFDFAAGIRWLTVFVEDVQQTYEELKAKGVKFITEPHPYGIACALDPDGLLIEFVHVDQQRLDVNKAP